MHLLISGSLAYDRIMNFEGRFADHILPDKIHVLNVSFNVSGLQEKLGGTAGNIAYGLALMGENPRVLACLGRDGQRYLEWMQSHGIDVSAIHWVEGEYTSGAFITTDMSDNQITGFNPGAMNQSCGFDPQGLDPDDCLAVVAPGGLQDMQTLPRRYRERGISFIFDPGQSLNIWSGEELAGAMKGARILISNDYELEMITRMTGRNRAGLLEIVDNIITTKGEEGSLLISPEGETAIPAAPAAEVTDPTGAGDAYRSGLMKGMVQGLDMAQACHWGAALASFAVACRGTQEYAVSPDDFTKRLAMIL